MINNLKQMYEHQANFPSKFARKTYIKRLELSVLDDIMEFVGFLSNSFADELETKKKLIMSRIDERHTDENGTIAENEELLSDWYITSTIDEIIELEKKISAIPAIVKQLEKI